MRDSITNKFKMEKIKKFKLYLLIKLSFEKLYHRKIVYKKFFKYIKFDINLILYDIKN